MLSAQQLEHLALTLVDRVKKGTRIEDSRYELKRVWPEPYRAARRIAAHANSAYGEDIIWIIGIDERQRTVVGAELEELANWLPQVNSFFDEVSPTLMRSINVPVDGTAVTALLFDTVRAPYVVKNPVNGQPGGGPVEWEVPWREGTRTRTARHTDLIRILVPLQQIPTVEVLEGELASTWIAESKDEPAEYRWNLELQLYIVPTSSEVVIIPFHQCQAEFSIIGSFSENFRSVELSPPWTFDWSIRETQYHSLTIQKTRDEVFITGPGKLSITATQATPADDDYDSSPVKATVLLRPIHATHPIKLSVRLEPTEPQTHQVSRWTLSDAIVSSPSQSETFD